MCVFFFSGQDVVKMDVQPKCVAVGAGGYAVVVCIGEVSIGTVQQVIINVC